ncbi:hypothetical protein GCM10027398_09760 [Azotobacter salinestris]
MLALETQQTAEQDGQEQAQADPDGLLQLGQIGELLGQGRHEYVPCSHTLPPASPGWVRNDRKTLSVKQVRRAGRANRGGGTSALAREV